jgi:hypothetical protein
VTSPIGNGSGVHHGGTGPEKKLKYLLALVISL